MTLHELQERECALQQAREHLYAARAARDSVEEMNDALDRLGAALDRASSVPPPPSGPRESVRIPPSRTMTPEPESDDALVVGAGGRYFRTPEQEPVDLSRRRALRCILDALAARRANAPGEALELDSLVDAGWPGERLMLDSGATRVYTAVATLRRMGLRHYLLRRDDGYFLDPAVPLLRLGA
jgi:hypothetical protein